MFKKNENAIDRLTRIILAEIFFVVGLFWVGGVLQIISYVLATLMLLTSFMGFCGLYQILGFSTKKEGEKKSKAALVVLGILIVAVGALGPYYSNFFTKKMFLENYNKMNNLYKQTLFNTGQDNREDSIANYHSLQTEYFNFSKKYLTYHPFFMKGDKEFNSDIKNIDKVISELSETILSGDLMSAHLKLEEVRPVFQDILKRNGFSILAVALVDFHDVMENVIEAANDKSTEGVKDAYIVANDKLREVEIIANDEEIKLIRKNLEATLEAANTNQVDELPNMAADLKGSFVKVYLERG